MDLRQLQLRRSGRETQWYSRFFAEARTGDLVMFSGRNLTSVIIEIATDSPNSHIGMVVRDACSGRLAIFESVRHGHDDVHVTDVLCGQKGRSGVRLVDAHERLSTYNGKFCCWRRLCGFDASHPSNQARVAAVIQRYWGRAYESHLIQLWRSPLRMFCLRNGRADTCSFFCSELVAQAYIEMGLLDGSVRYSNCYVPADFVHGARGLPWTHPSYQLEQDRYLLWPRDGTLAMLPCYDAFCCWACCGWLARLSEEEEHHRWTG